MQHHILCDTPDNHNNDSVMTAKTLNEGRKSTIITSKIGRSFILKINADPVRLNREVLIKNKTFVYFFNSLLLGSALYTAYLLIVTKTKEQSSLFFGGTGSTDTFMDFFNVLKYISTRDPYHYTELYGLGEKAYPPLAYLILYPFSKLFDYIHNPPFTAKATQFGIMSIVVFLGIALLVQFYILYDNKTGASHIKLLSALALLCSGVYLFTLERANLILWAAPMLALFLFWYKSENAAKREIAYIALACATGLKVYPVIFGVLLLKEKKWFASIRTMIYGAAAFFLPFLFFRGGFSNFSQLLLNAEANSLQYQFTSPVYRFGFLAYYLTANTEASDYQFYMTLGNVFLALAIVFVLGYKSHWKAAALLTCALIAVPTNSAYYCGIYLFAPVILFLNEEKHNIFDWVYVFLFFVILNPFQYVTDTGIPLRGIYANNALLMMSILLLAEAVFRTVSAVISYYRKKAHPKEVPIGTIN